MTIDFAHLIEVYGYAAVAVFCFLEGETVLALAGLAAHQGHLDLPRVIAIAAVAGWLGDQAFFWIGRRHGRRLLQRSSSLASAAARLQRLIERYHQGVIVLVRFAYGLRIAGPVLIGTARVSPRRFAFYNAIGAALWAPIVAGAGWLFGAAIDRVLGTLHDAELVAAGALLGAALLASVTRFARARRKG
ncbi:MAG TPA: DedA family protein [Burkholderiaceae bacterium]|nr:DedA family protein [Burkholderiaceae bacterium]